MNLKKIFSIILLIGSAFSLVACGGGGGGSDGNGSGSGVVEGPGYPEALATMTMVFDANNKFVFDAGNRLTGMRNGKPCTGTYSYKDGYLTMNYSGYQNDLPALSCSGTISGYQVTTGTSSVGTGNYTYQEIGESSALTPERFPQTFTLSESY